MEPVAKIVRHSILKSEYNNMHEPRMSTFARLFLELDSEVTC